MCWKLSHETPTGTSLSVAHQVLHVLISEKEKKEVGCVIVWANLYTTVYDKYANITCICFARVLQLSGTISGPV
jgi:hypothetical protein